jgi:hypothetical protein
MKEGKMSYYEFVWFLISEEDKRSPTRFSLISINNIKTVFFFPSLL